MRFFLIAAQALPLVLFTQAFWAMIGIFLILALAGLRLRPRSPDQLEEKAASLLLLTMAPVLVFAFAAWQGNALAGKPRGFYWQDGILVLLLAAQTLIAAWLLRRLKRRWLTLFCDVLALWYTAATAVVAGMAIHQDWL